MNAGPTLPRFHENRREGISADVGLFWELDPDDLARRLHDSEADRALRLARIEEIWADRTIWIDRYNALDAVRSTLTSDRDSAIRERDALRNECEGMRHAVVQARDLRIREQHDFARGRTAADMARAALACERDRLAAECVTMRRALEIVAAERKAQSSSEGATSAWMVAGKTIVASYPHAGWMRRILRTARRTARWMSGA